MAVQVASDAQALQRTQEMLGQLDREVYVLTATTLPGIQREIEACDWMQLGPQEQTAEMFSLLTSVQQDRALLVDTLSTRLEDADHDLARKESEMSCELDEELHHKKAVSRSLAHMRARVEQTEKLMANINARLQTNLMALQARYAFAYRKFITREELVQEYDACKSMLETKSGKAERLRELERALTIIMHRPREMACWALRVVLLMKRAAVVSRDELAIMIYGAGALDNIGALEATLASLASG